jgi:GAF domain-containing protein
MGWGVMSHQLALPGTLARALSVRSGRGTDVDVVADADITARNAIGQLSAVTLPAYDAFVVSLGVNDSLALLPVATWQRRLIELVDALRIQAPPRARIVLLGIPPIRSMAIYDTLLGSLVARHARALNQATLELCGVTPGLTYVPLEAPSRSSAQVRSREVYDEWAGAIADRLAPLMDLDRTARNARPATENREDARLAAVAALRLSDEPEERFDRVVGLAAQLFASGGAAFSIVDRDRVRLKSRVGADVTEIELRDAFCTTAVTIRGGLIVPDASRDPRFSSSSLVAGPAGIRFYAGYPVLAPSGETIGVLNVFDSRPRAAEDVDMPLLRRLALMVEGELAADVLARRGLSAR